jgi:homoserine acetyltransferase
MAGCDAYARPIALEVVFDLLDQFLISPDSAFLICANKSASIEAAMRMNEHKQELTRLGSFQQIIQTGLAIDSRRFIVTKRYDLVVRNAALR